MRRAIVVAAGVAMAGAAMAGSARADGPTGVEVGLRTGYALPLGDASGGNPSHPLSDVISGMVPIWVDAGYRFNPNMYIGADFQYGITFLNNDKTMCGMSGANCSSNDVMFGVNFHYHLMPDQTIDPWAGIGVGYEIFNFSTPQGSLASNGFQFVNVQLGGDYKIQPNFGVGPFLMFSLNEYSSCSASFMGMSAPGGCSIKDPSMHEWFTIGIRGEYDIAVGH